MKVWVGVGGVYLPHGRDEKPSRSTPTRSKLSIFRQFYNLIPNHLVPQLARDTGAQAKSC